MKYLLPLCLLLLLGVGCYTKPILGNNLNPEAELFLQQSNDIQALEFKLNQVIEADGLVEWKDMGKTCIKLGNQKENCFASESEPYLTSNPLKKRWVEECEKPMEIFNKDCFKGLRDRTIIACGDTPASSSFLQYCNALHKQIDSTYQPIIVSSTGNWSP